MITETDAKTVRRLTANSKDVFSLKILANLNAYEGQKFCKFYAGKNLLIGRYYDELVIRTRGISEEGAQELTLFMRLCGFSSALCGHETGRRLHADGFSAYENVLLEYYGCEMVGGDPDFSELKTDTPLDEVFEIIKDGFPKVKFDNWYPDISHRVRHGISRVFTFEGATVTEMFDINGRVFLSLIATKTEQRGKGAAGKLLRTLGAHYAAQGKETALLCREELIPFYKKSGFVDVGKTMTVENKIPEK